MEIITLAFGNYSSLAAAQWANGTSLFDKNRRGAGAAGNVNGCGGRRTGGHRSGRRAADRSRGTAHGERAELRLNLRQLLTLLLLEELHLPLLQLLQLGDLLVGLSACLPEARLRFLAQVSYLRGGFFRTCGGVLGDGDGLFRLGGTAISTGDPEVVAAARQKTLNRISLE
jgi:hypothetical protein